MQIREKERNKQSSDFYMVGGMGHSAAISLGVSLNTKKHMFVARFVARVTSCLSTLLSRCDLINSLSIDSLVVPTPASRVTHTGFLIF